MRRKDREVSEIGDILRVVYGAKFLHLALMDYDYPYIVPLHYGYLYDEEKDEFTFYMHGAKEGKKIDLIRRNPKSFIELEEGVKAEGNGDIACSYGAKFKSFMAKGMVSLLEEREEKIRAIEIFMYHQVGREFEITEKMTGTLSVINFFSFDYSCKVK